MSTAKPQKPSPNQVLLSLQGLLPSSAVTQVASLLRELLLLFYPPFRASSEEELAELATTGMRRYVEALAEFPEAILDAAWKKVLWTHKTERWPTVQVIRDACLDLLPRKADTPPPQSFYRSSEFGHIETMDEAKRRNDAWWAKRRASQTPSETTADNRLIARLHNGESPSSLLAEVMSGGVNAMPLMPHERMSRATKDRVRGASLRQAETVELDGGCGD